MGSGILIVCGQHQLNEYLLNTLSSTIPGHHVAALTGAEARRKTSLNEYEAILIAGKIADEGCFDLALELAQNGCSGVMVVVERGELYDAHDVLDGSGVVILSKPLSKEALLQSIKLIVKVAEGPGIFEKAKLMLMQQKSWSEPQAHRYIQKVSMDKRLPRDVTAQLVIRALEREQKTGSQN